MSTPAWTNPAYTHDRYHAPPTPGVKARIMDRLTDPATFRAWIAQHARAPGVSGKYVYCEGDGFGFNPNGHWVPFSRIVAGYRGHNVCGSCQAEHYPEAPFHGE